MPIRPILALNSDSACGEAKPMSHSKRMRWYRLRSSEATWTPQILRTRPEHVVGHNRCSQRLTATTRCESGQPVEMLRYLPLVQSKLVVVAMRRLRCMVVRTMTRPMECQQPPWPGMHLASCMLPQSTGLRNVSDFVASPLCIDSLGHICSNRSHNRRRDETGEAYPHNNALWH